MAFRKINLNTEKLPKSIFLGSLFFSIFSLVQIFEGLLTPSTYYFDESYYVIGSESLFTLDGIENWEHPPLAKIAIGIGRHLFSNPVFGARVGSFISLICILILLLKIVRFPHFLPTLNITPLWIFLIALTDPFLLNMSKIAMLDIYCVLWCLLGFWSLLNIDVRKSWIYWIMLGVAFGLGMSTKWNTLPIFIFFYGIIIYKSYISKEKILFKFLTSGLIAVGLYFVFFLPYLLVNSEKATITHLLTLQYDMLTYHRGFQNQNIHSSFWWSWILTIKPIWLQFNLNHDSLQGLLAIENIFISIFGISGLILCFYKRHYQFGVLTLGFYLSGLILWTFSLRTSYYHYYLISIPPLYFGCFYLMNYISQKYTKLHYLIPLCLISFYFVFLPFIQYKTVNLRYLQKIQIWMDLSYPINGLKTR